MRSDLSSRVCVEHHGLGFETREEFICSGEKWVKYLMRCGSGY